MTQAAWRMLADALDGSADGAPVRFWLRDDDAIAVTPALQRLEGLCASAGAPLLLASIPAAATPALGAWVAAHPGTEPCQHGYAHSNHAGADARACELGGLRDDAVVLAELAAGRARMAALFGSRTVPLLVPPWNRIRASLLPHLPDAGFAALSTFAGADHAAIEDLVRLDCDLDIIDWRHGRRGRDATDLCHRLLPQIATARRTGQPIGVLTHHLAHDETAWAFLEKLLPLIAGHPGATFTTAAAEIARQGSPGPAQ